VTNLSKVVMQPESNPRPLDRNSYTMSVAVARQSILRVKLRVRVGDNSLRGTFPRYDCPEGIVLEACRRPEPTRKNDDNVKEHLMTLAP